MLDGSYDFSSNPLSKWDTDRLREEPQCLRLLAAVLWVRGSPEHRKLIVLARRIEDELHRREAVARAA